MPWYAGPGVGALVVTLAAAITGLLNHSSGEAGALWCAIAFTIAHSVTASRAAPLNFSQRLAAGDPDALAAILDRFTRWHTARVALQVLSLAAVVWALLVHHG